MAQSIEVNERGVEIRREEVALKSVFGKEMRPAQTWSLRLPWEEIQSVCLYSMCLPPEESRVILMDINLINGECVTVHESDSGFIEAISKISQNSEVINAENSLENDEFVYLWRRCEN